MTSAQQQPIVGSTSLLAGTITEIEGARTYDERLESLRKLVSEASAEIHEIEGTTRVFTAELEHPRHGIFKIGVDPETLDGTVGSLLDISLALLTTAAHTAAARTIDARSFDTLEEHTEAVERRAASFQIIGIRHSSDAVRWLAKGHTTADQPFDVYVHAVDEGEADFQARWQIGTRDQAAPIRLSDLPAFLGGLYAVSIDNIEPKPVDLKELAEAADRLVKLVLEKCDIALVESGELTDLQRLLAKIPEWSANAPVSAAHQAHTATDAIQLEKFPEVPTADAPASSDDVEAPQPEDEAPRPDEVVRPKAVCIDLP